MNILAGHTGVFEPPPCLVPWCEGHLPADGDDVLHISPERAIVTSSADGFEQGRVLVCIEQIDNGQAAGLRLSGADSAPLSPAQAMDLAATLQAMAFAAVAGERVSR